ncbi:TPA: tetratricopeptide repeat protein [Vibrio vulnificus]|nr:tetratricopeptide repeat protein [Vibrio vulnificus]
MDEVIQSAIQLRKAGQYDQSRAQLTTLLQDAHYKALAHLHIAWSYDNQGLESQAVPHYLAAIQGNLTGDDRFEALFGLASTLRSLGDYQDALNWFEKTLQEFPERREVMPFYAICLYNLGKHHQSTALLLNLLVETTQSQAILGYQRAIALYAEDLDRVWPKG